MASESPLPTVSVVMPHFNHGRYLDTALPAMLHQTVPPLEIILIDDCSTDGSLVVLEKFARTYPSIRLIRNTRNQGVNANCNLGLDLARGDYVHFGAADDEIYPGLYEHSLKLLQQHPHAALCCTIGDWHELTTGFNWHVGVGMADASSYLSPVRMVELERANNLFIASHTALVRRQAALEVGKFIPELKWHADWFMLHTAGFRYGICYIPEALARFNIFPSSYYKSGRQDEAAHRMVLTRILDLLRKPEFEKEGALLGEAGSLFLFGWPILKLMLSHREYRKFITPTFMRKSLWHSAKLQAKKVTPRYLANWYFRLAGYRAPKRSLVSVSATQPRIDVDQHK